MVPLAGKKVLVMGLGRFGGGVAVARWLVEQGAIVTVNDAEPADKLAASIHALHDLPGTSLRFQLGGHDIDDFLAADLLIINPAVDKLKSEVVRQALAAGIPATTELNLFLERNPAFTIGITGSIGKSTTTALIDEALRAGFLLPHHSNDDRSTAWQCGGSASNPGDPSLQPHATPAPSPTKSTAPQSPSPRVFLGGNIGRSLLPDLPNIRPTDLVILELSSFMLEETPAIPWSPNIAVVTNLFANHLDRHDTLDNYAAAKRNILRFQSPTDTAILNADHPTVAAWATLAKGKTILYSAAHAGAQNLQLLLPGEHNRSNAQAAIAVLDDLLARGYPLDREAALQATARFPGLAHRLQLIHSVTLANHRTLHFFNDSKATTPDASITALAAFPLRTAIFLVGGHDKHIDLSPFEALLAKRAAGVIGLGQTGPAIIDHVRAQSQPPVNDAPTQLPPDRAHYAATLAAAIPLARAWANADPAITAIVLSPASASYGQFTNYEQRGETFITLSREQR